MQNPPNNIQIRNFAPNLTCYQNCTFTLVCTCLCVLHIDLALMQGEFCNLIVFSRNCFGQILNRHIRSSLYRWQPRFTFMDLPLQYCCFFGQFCVLSIHSTSLTLSTTFGFIINSIARATFVDCFSFIRWCRWWRAIHNAFSCCCCCLCLIWICMNITRRSLTYIVCRIWMKKGKWKRSLKSSLFPLAELYIKISLTLLHN